MSDENKATVELPRWRCHKVVWAAKLREITIHDQAGSNPPVPFAGGFMFLDLPGAAPVAFDAAFWEKHHPVAGGYLVIYPDGYRSFSPAKAFEEGYSVLPAPGQSNVPISHVEMQEFLFAGTMARQAVRVCKDSARPEQTILHSARESFRLMRFAVFAWLMQNGVAIPAELLDDRVHAPVGKQRPDQPS